MEKWRKILAQALRNTDELAERFQLPADALRQVNGIFPCRIPRRWLDKMTSPASPNARETLAFAKELTDAVRSVKTDALIEFRQGYANCAMLPYATQFRAGDAPFNAVSASAVPVGGCGMRR